MAGFDFPTNPPLGTITTTPDGAARSWDGVKWSSANGGPFLPLTGGTMKGPINLAAPPVSPAQAASKAYVDSLVGTGGGSTTDYRIIDLAGILDADPSSGVDATAAMQTALTMAASSSGSIIDLCPGNWNFMSAVPTGAGTAAAINACFLVPSRTLIRGGGMGQTCLYWNDSLCAFNLFDAVQVTTGSPLTFDIAFEEFTIYGSWDTNGDNVNSPPPATGGYPMLLHNVEKIRFTRVGSRFCRANAIATRYCIDVKTLACDIRYCAHGAIDHVSCSMVTVADCTIMHSDDNCIAVHSVHGEPWGVRKNVIIANNSVFDSVGISCVSPRSVLIANNKLDCIRLEGIALHEFTNDAAFDASAMGTVITNNSITNMIDESTITNPPIRVGNAGITISGNSARKGALPAIPGENVTTTTVVNGTTITAGTIIDDTVYFQSNDANTQVAIAVSRGYVIANNYIGRTMPPCDGTATAVGGTLTAGVPKTYNKYSDYGDTDPVGLGYMFLRKGWIDPGNPTPRPGSIVTPPLTVSALSGNGILLNGGNIRDVLITGNQFFGLDAAVTFLLCQPKDVVIRGNHIVDCGTSYGAIMVNLSAILPANEKLPCRVYIEDNFIDVDPYQRHSNRLPKGQWNPNIAPPLVPAALRVQVGSGVVFRNNTVRNAYVMISNQSSGVFESYGNTLEGYATAADSGLSNAGIGVLPLDGSRFRHIESDPTSAHYGELMSIPLTVSLSMPSTGLYIVGTYVAKSYTGPDPNGAVLRGWVRLTTGSSHVAGVDWTPVYDYATSNDLTALPVVGASNGVVVGIAFNGPPGAYQFARSDPYPSVVIDPPGTGGTQAVAHINRLACEVASPFTSSSTAIDHNLGSVNVIANGGVLYAVGETLTAVGGTFTQAVKGTVQAIGTLGDVTSLSLTQLGQYSAYPPDPTTWSGSAVGQGFTTHLQLWSTAGNPIVDNGGYYPNGTPNAIITPTNGDRGGRLTVKMGQSFVGSPTGLMLAGNATAPLQAVPLQQLTSATAGGPFLPLTGGTVAGATTFGAGLTAAVAHTIGSGANNILTVTPGSTTAANVTYVSTAGAPAGHQFGASSGNPIVIKPQATASSTSNIVALGTGSLGLVSGGTSPVLVGASGTGAIQAQQFTTANFSTVLSGATIPPPPGIFTTTVSGTSTATGVNPIGLGLKLGGSTDNAAIPHGAHYLEITQVITGAAYDGTRIGILSNQNVSANTTFSSAASGLIGAYLTVAGSANVGGATGFGNAKGQLFGADFTVALNTGATNWLGATGVEIDVLVNSGASVGATTGLQIVHLTGHGKQANLVDAALMIGDQTGATAGWKHGFLIGTGQSLWPIDTSAGYLFQAVGSSGFVAAAAGGIDVQHVSFTGTTGPLGSGFAFRADGVQLLPDTAGSGGALQAGSGVLQGTATGASLDTSAKQMTGTPTISAGGAGYSVGDTCADTNGNVIKVNTVSSGAVTAFTVVRRGWSSAATPPATGTFPAISVAGGTLGSGLVLNLTWTAQTTLALQPSGGATTFGGSASAASFAAFGSTITLAGTTVPTNIANFGAIWAGASTRVDFTGIATQSVGTSSDNASFTTAGGGRCELLINSNYGGTSFSGGRVGVCTRLKWNTTSHTTQVNCGLVGLNGVVQANVNAGGNSTGFGTVTPSFGSTNIGIGQLFGAAMGAQLQTGGTFFNQVVGQEIDGSIQTGASAAAFALLQLVITSDHATPAATFNNGLSISAQQGASAALWNAVVIGDYSNGVPVVDSARSYLFQLKSITGAATGAGGIDLLQFGATGTGPEGGGFAFRSPGTSGLGATAVDSTGALKLGSGYINANANGIVIDAPLYVLSGTPTVVSGGTNYVTGQLVGDSLGNLFSVTASAGVVSAVALAKKGEGRVADPSGTIACTARSSAAGVFGSGLTISETWAQTARTVSLAPSGGPITLPGVRVSTTYANDAAAATGGVAIGQLYRNGSVIQIRVA